MEILSLNSPLKPKQTPNRTITDLRPGVRDANRVNVFVDGKFSFSLDMAQVVELGVRRGLVLSDEKLAELRQASEFGKLYQRALEWVLSRPHSVRETQDYLRRRQLKRRELNWGREKDGKKALPEFSDETTGLVLTRLVERGYLDDEKFARYYVENRNARKGISLRKLRLELGQKGVAGEIVERAVAEVFGEGGRDEKAEIQKIIAKKRRKYDDEKMVAYLVRQGFDYATAKEEIQRKS